MLTPLSTSTVSISGTPTATRTFNPGSRDHHPGQRRKLTRATFSITINPVPAVGSLAQTAWTVNQPGYNQTISASGGTGSLTISKTAGTLPTGLNLSGAGVLSGTPTATGSFTFTVTATDSVGATGSKSFTVVINPAVAITTASLANWTVNQPGYSQTVSASGGTGTVTFTKTAGTLPTGLNLSGAGVLSGTPTATGSFTFTVTATDSVGATGSTSSFTVTISSVSTTQIIDDSASQGFATVGSWSIANNQGYDGNVHYAAAGTGSSVATWTFTVTPGQYDVAATWTTFANLRATNAPYTVLDGSTPRGTVPVNQVLAPSGFSDQGGTWQDLGTYTINGSQLVVQLSNSANGYVIADAIRIQFEGAAPTVQVQDGSTPIASGGSDSFGTTTVGSPVTRTFTVTNGGTQTLTLGAFGAMPAGFTLTQGFGSTSLAPGASTTFQVSLSATAAASYSGTLSFGTSDPDFSTYSFTVSGTVQSVPTTQIVDDSSSQGFATTGSWLTAGDQGYDGTVDYAAAGTGSSVATWTFTVTPGQYDVAATWTAYSNRATNAPYTVLDGSTPRGTVPINQVLAPSGFTDQGGTWQDLGTFTINGNQLVVQLSNNANGYVIADLVASIRIQFERRTSPSR